MYRRNTGPHVHVALKHKRLWDVGLGVRLGYGDDMVFPYALLGLRVCIDRADLTGVAKAKDKWWNGTYVPEILWEWGVGLEVPSPEGRFMGVEAAMGRSLF